MIKSRRLRWACRVERMGEMRGACKVLVRKPEGKRPRGSSGVDGRIMLKWIFENWDRGKDWIDLAEDRDRWRALVNAVMNRRVP